MKILHIINTLCVGGIENAVVGICNRMSTSHEVHLLVLTNNDLSFLPKVNSQVHLEILPLKRHNNMMVNIAELTLKIPHLVKLIRKISPQIIHTHMYQYNILPVLIAMNMSKVPFRHFHTIHTTGLHYSSASFSAGQKIKVERFAYNRFKTNLICVSLDIERITKPLFEGACNQMQVIENGVDNTLFDPSKFSKKTGKPFRLIYTSRIVDGKNHETLLRAFQQVTSKYSDVELWLVGDGVLEPSLKRLSQQMGLEKSIKFWGHRNDIPELLSQCDLAVFPSEYEGFSVALVEMMAMGLPVICSDIQNFRDIFSDKEAQFFPVHDYMQLADKIESVYNDSELLSSYSACSLKLAQKYFLPMQCSRLNAYYQSYND